MLTILRILLFWSLISVWLGVEVGLVIKLCQGDDEINRA